jgi:hypothetical protein
MTTETARHLQRELEQVESRLRSTSRSGLVAVRQLAVFEREALPEQEEEGALVLTELGAPGRS